MLLPAGTQYRVQKKIVGGCEGRGDDSEQGFTKKALCFITIIIGRGINHLPSPRIFETTIGIFSCASGAHPAPAVNIF